MTTWKQISEGLKAAVRSSHHNAFKRLGLKHSTSNHDDFGETHLYYASEKVSPAKIHKGIEKLGYKYGESDHERHEDATHGMHYYQHKKDANQYISVTHDTRGIGGTHVAHYKDKG